MILVLSNSAVQNPEHSLLTTTQLLGELSIFIVNKRLYGIFYKVSLANFEMSLWE